MGFVLTLWLLSEPRLCQSSSAGVTIFTRIPIRKARLKKREENNSRRTFKRSNKKDLYRVWCECVMPLKKTG